MGTCYDNGINISVDKSMVTDMSRDIFMGRGKEREWRYDK